MNNVLVLGSSGQIGKSLVKSLRERHYFVQEFDILNGADQDLRIQSEATSASIEASDFIFFLAFDVGGSKYLEKYQNSFEFMDNNLAIMRNTFSTLKLHKKNFIFASSQMSNMNFSSYGVLKKIGELLTDSLPNGRYVKFWNVYGYEESKEKYHVISDFIDSALNRRSILMRTNGEEFRDFLYSDDCSKALIAIMENFNNLAKNDNFDIASFRYTKIKELADIVCNYTGATVTPGDKVDQVQQNSLNLPNPSILKYWQPETSLENGVLKIINETIK